MPPTIDPRVDAYLETVPEFARPILERVRKAFHQGCPDLVETMKWSRPHFEHHGLLGGMSAFKAHCTFGFWRGKELDDPDGILDGVGQNTDMAAIKVETVKDLPTLKVLKDYVKRAAKLNESLEGKPKRKAPAKKKAARPAPKAPADLAAALKKNKKAKITFDGFSPSKKREYVDWITEAKREATREKRLAQAIEWMSEGKSKNWKYENC